MKIDIKSKTLLFFTMILGFLLFTNNYCFAEEESSYFAVCVSECQANGEESCEQYCNIANNVINSISNTINSASSSSIMFDNPLDYGTVEGFLGNVLSKLQSIIAIICIIFIVIGGLMYITSVGDSGRVEKAKATVTYAMIGLAIAIAAPSFLKEISAILGWTEGEDAAGDALTLSEIAMNVLDFLLSIVGIVSIIMLVVGGIMYVTSAGDEDKIDTGKKIVKYSIIGIIVALSSLIIVRQIAGLIAG